MVLSCILQARHSIRKNLAYGRIMKRARCSVFTDLTVTIPSNFKFEFEDNGDWVGTESESDGDVVYIYTRYTENEQ